ncbi:AEC family transporter [Marinomonas sp.]
MEAMLTITAPIFFVILLGFLAVRHGFLAPQALPSLSRFILYLALPALIFTKLSSMNIRDLVDLDYIFVYAVGGLLAFSITVLIARFVFRQPWDLSGVRGVGGSMPNSAFIGLPVLIQSFEHAPTQAFAMALIVENVVFLPIYLFFVETMKGQSQANGQNSGAGVMAVVAKRLVTNPLLLSVVSGLVCSLLGWQLPAFMQQSFTLLGGAAAATALIVIGGSLVGVSIRGQLSQIGLVAVVKLMLFPLIASLLLVFTPNMHQDLKLAVVILAAMPMFTSYPIIFGEYGEKGFCASALLVTTVLSFFTLSVMLSFLV